ncbi:hypothetical protein NE236_14050 [Actinoallomurus purpureus]|uniref:hypothetical protein n=1 Tax=Actinoallomurus purpureus TaxID=478114 RepID=UPI002091F466|nr:hypothetical protein [Actinoallomurus purpureus]MCO6006112.1 hypothetical protein [Actinoallomurus purpureus]
MPQPVLFEMDDPDDEFTSDERAFVAELSDRLGALLDSPEYGSAFRDEEGDALVTAVSLTDPEARLSLVDLGTHLANGRVRGDRLHNQLYFLPESPSSWALDETGDVGELARRSAEWFARMLRRPIVLYVWLHERYAYAARYAFADRDETLCQSYIKQLAPVGQTERLIADGHVWGKGWIQTIGLPVPSLYLHIRGDLELASLPSGVSQESKRGPLSGTWYQ